MLVLLSISLVLLICPTTWGLPISYFEEKLDTNVAPWNLSRTRRTANSISMLKGLSSSSSCLAGHFACKENPRLCVPQSANCNGIKDCPEGSDEEKCEDPHIKEEWDRMFVKRPDQDAEKYNGTCWYATIPGSEFTLGGGGSGGGRTFPTKKPMIQLIPLFGESMWDLGLDEEGNEEESGTVFYHHPEAHWLENYGCICAEKKIFCQNMRTDNLHFIPIDVEFLDLGGSRVENMDFSLTPFPNLQTLVLSGCYIEDIAPGAFADLPSLQVLYLTNNRLRYLARDFFARGLHLQRLFLDYNQISVIQPDSFQGLENLVDLNLRYNILTGRESEIFSGLTALKNLHLDHNRIETLRRNFLRGLSSLETLSLQSNLITYIEIGAFEHLKSLKELYLHWNKLRVLENRVFCNLGNLLTLNLRGNEISQVEHNAFSCLESLTSLNVEQNPFGEMTESEASRIFEKMMSLEYIYFDHFWMCSWALHVRSCEPKGDGISSITNLLDSVILRVCVWIMGILSIAGNIFVIFCRMIIREPNRVHSFYIRNLAAADLLMGFFLLNIGFHDILYRGEFLAYQYQWRNSLTCQISGVLSTWSSEASVLILTLITLDRYISIVQPFADKTTSINVAFSIVLFLWFISLIVSVIPLMGLFPSYFDHFYTSNGLCLPLHIHNPYDMGWEYSFVLFVLLNLLAFPFMCFAYVRMLQVIRNSNLMIRSTQQKQDSVLAKRFAIIMVTDFLCWAPIVGAKLVGMAGVEIPSDLYAWLAVFALPVNSALNPILYTLSTKLFQQQLEKFTRSFHSRLLRRTEESSGTASLSIFRNKTTRRTGNTSLSRTRRQNTFTSGSTINGNATASSFVLPSRQCSLKPGSGQAIQLKVFSSSRNKDKEKDESRFLHTTASFNTITDSEQEVVVEDVNNVMLQNAGNEKDVENEKYC